MFPNYKLPIQSLTIINIEILDVFQTDLILIAYFDVTSKNSPQITLPSSLIKAYHSLIINSK